jgi:hypothetical protein
VLVGGYQITDMGQPIFCPPKAPGAERGCAVVLAVSFYASATPAACGDDDAGLVAPTFPD